MCSLKEKFGARIQEIRKSKNLTQEKLAEMINLDTPNLSNIERGKRFVSSETFSRIVKALDIEEKELFDFKHLVTKDELIKLINDILNTSDLKDLRFYYRMMKIYKEI